MKIYFFSPLAITICAAMSLAQTPAPQAQTQNQIAPGTIIPAELSKTVDAKKIKSGDKIEAKTTVDLLSHGQIVIPRNTRIEGHVTDAKAHSKASPDSMVGIAFDRISTKDGRDLPLQASVQAIGRPLQSLTQPDSMASPGTAPSPASSPSPQRNAPMEGSSSPNVSQSAAANYPGSYPSASSSPPSSDSGSSVSPLGPNSQGAVGMKGLTLSGTKTASVIASSNQNVHLDGGTQLILRTE